MTTTRTDEPIDEAARTSPLALWRYAHEYLSVARNLCMQLRIRCDESQAPYHVAAQGIEFALKSFLRVRGATMEELHRDVGHSLHKALDRSEAQGLPSIPAAWRAAIVDLAPFHQDQQFVYIAHAANTFPDIAPLVDAGVWILYCITPQVVDHFVVNLGTDSTPSPADFVRRLHAALSVTSGVVRPHEAVLHETARTFSGETGIS